MIYALSPYQIGYLAVLFNYTYAPMQHRIEVQQIGISDEGILIVSFIQYGVHQRQSVPREQAERIEGSEFRPINAL